MPDMTHLIKELEDLWETDFPMNRSMRLSIEDYNSPILHTFAPLTGNTNTHNTAFAGSLYALQALSAWGLIWLELKVAGIEASIIHASGDIKFPAPLTTDIYMKTQWPDATAAPKMKRSMVEIRNLDNLCLARSLLVCLAKAY